MNSIKETIISDSDDSIYEVPVPPKPTPTVINLDSDNEDYNERRSSIIECSSKNDKFNLIINTVFCGSVEQLNETGIEMNSEPTIKRRKSCIPSIENEIYRATKNNSNNTNFPTNINDNDKNSPMTKSMQDFYNKSWGGENFELEDVLRSMSNDPKQWTILDVDMKANNKFSRYWEICKRCNKSGHMSKNCPNNKRKTNMKICHICGIKGHFDIRCPQRMCLTCGTKQNTFRKTCEYCHKIRCISCKSIGHKIQNCPDNWRRFHSTIRGDTVEAPVSLQLVMKPKSKLFCCNCRQKGHEWSTCTRYKWSSHFPSPAFVTNYKIHSILPHIQPLLNPFACNPYEKNAQRLSPEHLLQSNNCHDMKNQSNSLIDINSSSNSISLNEIETENVEISENKNKNVDPSPTTISTTNYVTFLNNSEDRIIFSLFKSNNTHKKLELTVPRLRKEVYISLYEKTTNFFFIQKLYEHINFALTLKLSNKFFTLSIYCQKKYLNIMQNIILMWLKRTPEEQNNLLITSANKDQLVELIDKNLFKLLTPLQEPNVIYQEVKRLESMLQGHKTNSILTNYNEQKLNLTIALYKCGVIKKANSKLHSLIEYCKICKENEITDLVSFLNMIYFMNIVFTPHENQVIESWVRVYSNEIKLRQSNKEYSSEASLVLKYPFLQQIYNKYNKINNNESLTKAPALPYDLHNRPPFYYNNPPQQNNNNFQRKHPKICNIQPVHGPNTTFQYNYNSQNALQQEPPNVIQYITNIIEQPLPGQVGSHYTFNNNFSNNSVCKNVENIINTSNNTNYQTNERTKDIKIKSKAKLIIAANNLIRNATKLNSPELTEDIRILNDKLKTKQIITQKTLSHIFVKMKRIKKQNKKSNIPKYLT